MNRSDDLNRQIAEQTALIAELESSYPDSYDPSAGRHAKVNRPTEIHHTKVRDAYWRRRMLIAKRDDLDEQATAAVY